MALSDAHVFPGFLTPLITLLFSHVSVEVRGEHTPKRKFAIKGSRTHKHQVMSPTRSPLSYSDGAATVEPAGTKYFKHPSYVLS